MALFEFKLPDLGEGVAEGEVVAWHVEPGQRVSEDQEMVEVMTDKATVTIGAPRAGRIAQLNASVGEKVRVGTVLVVIDTAAQADSTERRAAPRTAEHDTVRSRFQAPVSRGSTRPQALKRSEGVVASAVGDLRENLPGASFFAREPAGLNGRAATPPAPVASKSSSQAPSPAFYAEKPLATPATRKLARDLGVDLRRVPPTGPGGRVTKQDLEGFSGARAAPDAGPAREERTPFVGLRRRIAERMQLARHKAAHFTFVEEVDVGALKALIERVKPMAERRGVKLHYLPFIIKAVTLALAKHPMLNSMLDEETNELVLRRYYNIGVATATDQGLVVPVVRDADRKSPLELAREVQRLADGARAGKLSSAELSGSTFTVTSLGRMGGLLATPVLNHPEVGILGVHRVKERPIVRDGQIVIGHVMLLSLSFDHRIIDGHVGAAFAYDIIEYLEQPELLLME